MKKYWLYTVLMVISLFFCCCTATQENAVVDIDFARNIAIQAINDEGWEQIYSQIESMDDTDLAECKKMLLSLLRDDPPITQSITGMWLIYKIIYEIDDRLGVLEYTRVVEGIFNWERAASLIGTTDLDFIADNGQQLPIFTTVATIDKRSAYLKSEGRRVKIYIREESLDDGSKRNHVVKIEPLY